MGMKNLLAILFLAFTLAASAQTYPVISTTTNRTLAITPLAVQLVSSNTTAGVRTLLNITNATGLEATAANLTTVSNTVTTQGNTLATNTALLNGTNVMAGTNRFTGTVILTNAASTISGNGAGLTNLAAGNIASGSLADARLSANVPLLNGANVFTGSNQISGSLNIPNTNIYSFGQPVLLTQTVLVTNGVGLIANVAYTNNVMATTVSNGFKYTTPIFDARLPAVPANYRVTITWFHEVTNANAGSLNVHCYVGENTNYMSGTTGAGSTGTLGSNGYYILTSGAMIPFITWGSSTNQFAQGPYPFNAAGNPGTQVDCSTNNWRCMLGVITQGGTGTYTNYNSIKVIVTYTPLF
jgi:hypothetical protein